MLPQVLGRIHDVVILLHLHRARQQLLQPLVARLGEKILRVFRELLDAVQRILLKGRLGFLGVVRFALRTKKQGRGRDRPNRVRREVTREITQVGCKGAVVTSERRIECVRILMETMLSEALFSPVTPQLGAILD